MSNLTIFKYDDLGTAREGGPLPERVIEGNAFVMKPDFTGVWRCIETTRKIWVVYQ